MRKIAEPKRSRITCFLSLMIYLVGVSLLFASPLYAQECKMIEGVTNPGESCPPAESTSADACSTCDKIAAVADRGALTRSNGSKAGPEPIEAKVANDLATDNTKIQRKEGDSQGTDH